MDKEIYWVRMCFEIDRDKISREDLDTIIDDMLRGNNDMENVSAEVEERIGA